MKNAINIFSYKGIPVYIKYWFLILILFLPPVKIISLFIGVLIHELAHALKAKKLGYKTDYVFIDVLYGGALVDSKYRFDNISAIKIALAGPLSNLYLSAIGFILATITHMIFGNVTMVNHLSVFVTINLILGIGNLLPIYPLDGGRISKGILNLFYDRKKSRRINSIISLVVTLCLITFSIISNYWLLLIFSMIFLITAYSEWNKK